MSSSIQSDFENVGTVLQRLQAGVLTNREVASAVNLFATVGYVAALPEVHHALDNTDAVVRISALNAISFTFDSDTRLERVAEMFSTDPDEDVRCSAATTLGILSRKRHPECRELLRASIRNVDEAAYVRTAAYEALLDSLGVPTAGRPSIEPGEIGEIDFSLLDRVAVE